MVDRNSYLLLIGFEMEIAYRRMLFLGPFVERIYVAVKAFIVKHPG